MNHFVHYARGQRWGQDLDLFTAMRNAGVTQLSKSETYAEAVDECMYDKELKNLQRYLDDAKRSWNNLAEDAEPIDFTVVITDNDLWKITGADPVDESPRYEWIGEGPMPEKVDETVIKLTLMPDGTIKTRK